MLLNKINKLNMKYDTLYANVYVNSIFIKRIINIRYQQTIHQKYKTETSLRKKLAHKHLLNFKFNIKSPKTRYIV